MNCDRIAPWYRWFEYAGFGRALERRRFAFLDALADARRVLVLGDGDGRFLERLARANRGACIDYVDLSGRMLELARGRAGMERIRYRQADARTVPLGAARYDLIVTHFFLDCFSEEDAAHVIARIVAAAQPDARWLISEFRAGGWAQLWLPMLYAFFRVTTGLRTRRLVDHHPLLACRGFALERLERSRFGMLASELWRRTRMDQ